MSSRQWASLLPEERQAVIQGLLEKLTPNLEKIVNQYIESIEPKVRQVARDEVGRFAVTEKQAQVFLDGLVNTACQRLADRCRLRWLGKILFHF